MGRKARVKMTVGPKTQQLIDEVQKSLEDRGSLNFDSGELIEAIIEAASKSIVDAFVSEKTPMEYKFKIILQNESLKKELDKLAKKHDFGLGISSTPQA